MKEPLSKSPRCYGCTRNCIYNGPVMANWRADEIKSARMELNKCNNGKLAKFYRRPSKRGVDIHSNIIKRLFRKKEKPQVFAD